MKRPYEPIENYGIIGDLHTAALVSKHGSIDFLCFPRFDSPTVFASMLDADKGGSFSIKPMLEDVKGKQIYLPDTAILLTRFFAEDGIAEMTDFMPIETESKAASCKIVRKISTIRGKITYRMRCKPRFDYARAAHEAQRIKNGLMFVANDERKTALKLLSTIPMRIQYDDAAAEFTLGESESAYFVLEGAQTKDLRQEAIEKYAEDIYHATLAYWRAWMSKLQYKGRWRETVKRSAITLKLLISREFGSMVAAPTFGLPEAVGGARNWDYRYTWIRDAAFTMYVFLQLGFMEEAARFIEWIQTHCMTGEQKLMYALDGETTPEERELPHLEGYMNSAPVRIGNEAHRQFQLDIYGELIDTIYLYNEHGGAITYEFWKKISALASFVTEHWRKPDHSIWEVRHEIREFLYSRMMCWVAVDRAIRIAERCSFPYPAYAWRNVRDEIFNDIYNNFWNPDRRAFVQYKGSSAIDASVLLMSLRRILPPSEERWKRTMEAVDKELRLDVLLYRYRISPDNPDGLPGDEGTFCMCSFWYIECLAKTGDVEKAREYFEKLLGYANPLGLFAEQLGFRGEHLGNFPQAFTHLALISAALELNRHLETP